MLRNLSGFIFLTLLYKNTAKEDRQLNSSENDVCVCVCVNASPGPQCWSAPATWRSGEHRLRLVGSAAKGVPHTPGPGWHPLHPLRHEVSDYTMNSFSCVRGVFTLLLCCLLGCVCVCLHSQGTRLDSKLVRAQWWGHRTFPAWGALRQGRRLQGVGSHPLHIWHLA